ncbi:hypothetical protein DEO72_LG5g914 [Vigna unguiculata]|uniref:Uncharacterized protein n=1 Tax=Vigna unguiculata TaxID=3917 RepID=A0A4D6LVZ5_VIGUN|nr:hypothetical protein DEO72_LG5g914 [Vigna unguiculata]
MSNNALRKRAASMVATQNLLLQPTITSAAKASLNALGRGLRGRRRVHRPNPCFRRRRVHHSLRYQVATGPSCAAIQVDASSSL